MGSVWVVCAYFRGRFRGRFRVRFFSWPFPCPFCFCGRFRVCFFSVAISTGSAVAVFVAIGSTMAEFLLLQKYAVAVGSTWPHSHGRFRGQVFMPVGIYCCRREYMAA